MHPRALEAERNCAALSRNAPSSTLPCRGGALDGEVRAIELLGTGGSSQVWRAIDSSGRQLALKTLRPELRHEPGAQGLLVREYEVLNDVRHPQAVCAYGIVEHCGATALAMEYLGGGDLVSLAGSNPRHWIGAVGDLLAVLAHVHARGYAHRDIKARNVLFDLYNRPRLVDFASAAKFGVAGAPGGTTAAHRFRTRRGALVGPHEDVFAFAVLLYELMTGRLPFGSDGETAASSIEPPQLSRQAEPALQALTELVAGTLRAQNSSGVGSLSRFADVIESVVAGGL